MRRNNATTLKTVAEAAGVSAMMVSVVLNGASSSTRVSAATRARILEVAGRMGYRRNAAALGLSRRRMNTIGVAAVVESGELNLYFLEVLNGILEGAAEEGQNTTVFSIPSWTKDEQRLLNSCDGRIDGLILIAPQFTPDFARDLFQQTPFVTLHSNVLMPDVYNLGVDNASGACNIVRHLISQGHRRILHISGGEDTIDSQQRLVGYRRALAEAGIAADDSLIIHANFSSWAGRFQMQEFLNRHPSHPLPTAIFCASDAIAFGCMEALAQRGLRVPKDISIVGFDDTLLARMTRPPLTTVCQPFRQMGRCAVKRLLALVCGETPPENGESDTPAQDETSVLAAATELFALELVLRESVAPPPQDALCL